ncbi:MAG: ECF transporter S component [Clostridia bacterium]|nr:ECF transporter S component [Clostridia bacterium]
MIFIRNENLRRLLRVAIPYLAVPGLVLLGALVFDEKRHLIVSFGVAVLALLLFAAGFDRRQIGARRMVIIAVMTALSIVGRLIPVFKPIAALTILTAMYLGSESGFLVGAMSALVSNFYFGQGPWTPFQMLAWGLIGLVAGYLAGPLKRSRAFLLFYGLLSGIFFSFVMDIWTVLWYNGTFSPVLWVSAAAAAVPHTIMYSASNLLFLWFLAGPIGEKLERVRVKYDV